MELIMLKGKICRATITQVAFDYVKNKNLMNTKGIVEYEKHSKLGCDAK